MPPALQHLRGATLTFSARPDDEHHPGVRFIDDAVITLESGRIRSLLPVDRFEREGGRLDAVDDLRPGLILPGFVDLHVHYSQLDIIASFGRQLLDWLEDYAFPAERAFADEAYATEVAERFMSRLFEFGTTTAMTFTTVHAQAAEAFFRAAARVDARMLGGKVLMDRNAPADLCDRDDGRAATLELIERWHGNGRLGYAVTPRFAITSSPAQLAAAGDVLARHPDVYLQTHISESAEEVATTMKLFPAASDYLDVYARHGLLTERAVFAHGIHLSDAELIRMRAAGAAIAFCPSSNLFLGSGLMQLARVEEHGVGMGLGSDVGGGTHLSLLATAADGYKVSQMTGKHWHPLAALDAMTRGGAEALGLAEKIGTLEPGSEADLVILDATPGTLLAERLAAATTLTERVFAFIFLGAEHGVARTYVGGVLRHARTPEKTPGAVE